MAELPAAFVRAVNDVLPADTLSQDADEVLRYGRDWTTAFPPAPGGLARPRDADAVAALVRLCRRFQVAIVPSGGRTGLAAGAVATRGELVLSLERMRGIDPVDALAGTVRCEAGTVTQALHDHVAAAGLSWPIDLAAKGSSTIGGNLSTNAGGLRVIRYGHARAWVRGLEVVTGTGERLAQLALEKNNTGLDLRQLYVGSEGTLGIITAATLALTLPPGRRDVLLFAVDGAAAALAVLASARAARLTPSAFEMWTAACAEKVADATGQSPPLAAAPAYALLEVEQASEPRLLEWSAAAGEIPGVRDGVLAESGAAAAGLWRLRERITESLARSGPVHKNDVTLPLGRLAELIAAVEARAAARTPRLPVFLFGHVGDGNIHINTLPAAGMAAGEFFQLANAIDHEVFALVRSFGGSISSEHGIGLVKKPFLSYSRSPAELAVMRAVKRALDPDGILNPGKIFDL